VKGEERVNKLFSRSSTSIKELLAKADRLRDQKQWGEAASLYRSVLDADSSLAHIWIQYGHSLKETGQYDEAERAYKLGCELKPSGDAFLQLGHLYNLTKRKALAEESYLHALRAEPGMADAERELLHLGWSTRRLLRARFASDEALGSDGDSSPARPSVALELSDLVDFLQGARYPTGIQRVQLALAEALQDQGRGTPVYFVCFDNTSCMFNLIEPRHVERIVDLVTNTERPEDIRRELASSLKLEILNQIEFPFPPNCTLVNLGTSWGYHNYFLGVRDVKRRYGVQYAPLVHDVIPLLFPEYCNQELVADFINWIDGMFELADLLFANSQNTLNDVREVAARLGRDLPPSHLLLLNGEFRNQGEAFDTADHVEAEELFRAHNLDSEDYVLMVSTIEPRKNHALALNAWSSMIKRNDGRPIPYLVCVGNPGWRNEAFYQRLRDDAALRDRVVVLLNVSDQALNLLYDRAMFTIFPSLYEGWGLPISEALAHGKVPLVSRVSSHPEAGGKHAVYFDLASERDFQSRLETLIYDVDHRSKIERDIAASKPLRPWSEIGADITAVVDAARPAKSDDAQVESTTTLSVIETGRYYVMARNREHELENILYRGEAFRWGTNWYPPDTWGCWVRGKTSELRFRVPDQGEKFQIYLALATPNFEEGDQTLTVSLPAAKWSRKSKLASPANVWQSISLRLTPRASRDVVLRLSGERVFDFGTASEGRDKRKSAYAVRGLYIARADSEEQRLALLEALQLDDLVGLSRRFQRQAVI
jgi:glycosyltransferase involved in cell wall biosynthesis